MESFESANYPTMSAHSFYCVIFFKWCPWSAVKGKTVLFHNFVANKTRPIFNIICWCYLSITVCIATFVCLQLWIRMIYSSGFLYSNNWPPPPLLWHPNSQHQDLPNKTQPIWRKDFYKKNLNILKSKSKEMTWVKWENSQSVPEYKWQEL